MSGKESRSEISPRLAYENPTCVRVAKVRQNLDTSWTSRIDVGLSWISRTMTWTNSESDLSEISPTFVQVGLQESKLSPSWTKLDREIMMVDIRYVRTAFDLLALLIAVLYIQLTIFMLIAARLAYTWEGYAIAFVELFILAFPYNAIRMYFRRRI